MARDNPFDVPSGRGSSSYGSGSPSSRPLHEARLTDLMETYMIRARPWMMFLGVITFIGAGLMVIGAIFLVLAGLLAAAGSGRPQDMMMGVLGVVYVGVAALYAYPAWCLVQGASAAGRLVGAFDAEDKELAAESMLQNVQNLFRFMGIVTAIAIGLYILFFILVCFMGAAMGSMLR